MKNIKIIILVLSFLFVKQMELFSMEKDDSVPLSILQDSISGIDFNAIESDVFSMYATSLIPRLVTKPLSNKLASETRVLSFDYICPEGFDVIRIWYSPDFKNKINTEVRRIAPSQDWATFSVDLSDDMENWGNVGDYLHIDIGDDADTHFKIRDLKLRTWNKEERRIAELRSKKNQRDALLEKNLSKYLDTCFDSQIKEVNVTETEVKIKAFSQSSNQVYLCEIPPYKNVTEDEELETCINVDGTDIQIILPRFITQNGYSYDRLLSKWVLVEEKGKEKKLVSHARYADHVQALYNLPDEKPATKKGLGGFFVGKGPVSDLDDLGITSVTVNIRFTRFMYASPHADRIKHPYGGENYYFDRKAVARLDSTLKETAKRDIIVAAILLVNKAEECADPEIGRLLQHPDMDSAGNYSMPNMTTPESVNCYAAALDFLASRYSLPDKLYGRVHHWIMHNEVNMGWVWTNMGRKSSLVFMDSYIKSMRMCYNIARSYNPHSEVMISVTKQWLWKSSPRFFLVKDLMDILLDYSKVEGDFQWGMANHPYPQSLFEPKTWFDEEAQFNMNTPLITFKNLEVLDEWIKLPEVLYQGKYKRTLWLSENGTNSRTYTQKDLSEQAAGFAFAWEKIKRLDGIDAFQWHNWTDSRREFGLRIGLRRFPDDENKPLGKKPVWYAFRAAGTEIEDEVLEPYKSIIGVNNWDEIMYKEFDVSSEKIEMRKEKTPPNIIFLLTDDQRFDAMGVMGNPIIHTPHMDRLASQGILFRNAYVTTSICCVSRASILTGQYESGHKIHDFSTDLSDGAFQKTYPYLLKESGYKIGFIGKYGVGHHPPSSYFDYWIDTEAGGKGQPDYITIDKSGNEIHDTDTIGSAIQCFLDQYASKKPFCLSVSFKAPHEQDGNPPEYIIQPKYRNFYRDETIPEPVTAKPKYWESFPDFFQTDTNFGRARWKGLLGTSELHQENVKNYYRLVTGVDDVIGQMVEKLKELGIEENTVIMLMGDNGMLLGEHGMEGKWYGYEESVRVPFFIYYPNLPDEISQYQAEQIALNIDVAPTILSLAGIPVPSQMQGQNLIDVLGDKIAEREHFFYQHYFLGGPRIPRVEGVVGRECKYMNFIEYGFEELYDTKHDPHETKNLALDPDYTEKLERLREKYNQLKGIYGVPAKEWDKMKTAF